MHPACPASRVHGGTIVRAADEPRLPWDQPQDENWNVFQFWPYRAYDQGSLTQGQGADEVVSKQVKQLDRVIIRFAGDSGDGMQLTGDRFTQESAAFGNDLVTLPNFPAEIRAPQGTLPGVSSFQVHFADHDILTAGDAPDVLVAMNPAALRANLGDLDRKSTRLNSSH